MQKPARRHLCEGLVKCLAAMWGVVALTGAAMAVDPATMPAVADPKALKLPAADMQWWQDAKFGMFIHWGLYAIPAQGEWYMNDKKVPVEEYRKLMEQFNPQRYDPAAWAKTAKDAGMKYMVLTARHHDGFALWDSPSSYDHFDAVHSAAKRDLIAPYVKAARDAGMRVGLYYSPMDWRFPGYFDPNGLPDNAALMKKQTWGQVEELLRNFGTIDILWYDGGWLAMKGSDADAAPFWESDKLAQMARSYQPKVVISPRSGWVGDFGTDEGGAAVTGPIRNGPWEKCLNLNETTWGYNTRQRLMSRDRALNMLINTVVRGGNMLLNVGSGQRRRDSRGACGAAEGNRRLAGQARRIHLWHPAGAISAGGRAVWRDLSRQNDLRAYLELGAHRGVRAAGRSTGDGDGAHSRTRWSCRH